MTYNPCYRIVRKINFLLPAHFDVEMSVVKSLQLEVIHFLHVLGSNEIFSVIGGYV